MVPGKWIMIFHNRKKLVFWYGKREIFRQQHSFISEEYLKWWNNPANEPDGVLGVVLPTSDSPPNIHLRETQLKVLKEMLDKGIPIPGTVEGRSANYRLNRTPGESST